jgi:hypothetical protein
MPGLEQRPAADEYTEFYAGYVHLVPDGHIVATLELQIEDTLALLRGPAADRADHAYAPGKWTVKQVIGHLGDVERLMSCRALRFARHDSTPLPGFDENTYVETAGFEDRPVHGLIDDFAVVRQGTVRMFRGLPGEAWSRHGTANGKDVSVRALAWIIAGHELHHLRILQERYLG